MRTSDHRPVYAEFVLTPPQVTSPGKKRGMLSRRLMGPLHRLAAAFCLVPCP
jgi:hypothetical protein